MTTTTALCRRRRREGFTLTEIMIGMALAGMVATALFASWGFIARSSVSLANYIDMNSVGRRGLEVFAKDVRTARNIRDFSSTGLTLVMDEDANQLIHYDYDPTEQVLLREANGGRDEVFTFVDALEFTRFSLSRREAINNLETKQIQLELSMARPSLAHETTKKIVSARYIMRNKRMTQ